MSRGRGVPIKVASEWACQIYMQNLELTHRWKSNTRLSVHTNENHSTLQNSSDVAKTLLWVHFDLAIVTALALQNTNDSSALSAIVSSCFTFEFVVNLNGIQSVYFILYYSYFNDIYSIWQTPYPEPLMFLISLYIWVFVG